MTNFDRDHADKDWIQGESDHLALKRQAAIDWLGTDYVLHPIHSPTPFDYRQYELPVFLRKQAI